jgi:hypothetical protein
MATRTVDTRIGPIELQCDYPSGASVQKLYDELDFQRAVQAYIWATPLVSCEALRLANKRDWGVDFNDVSIVNGYTTPTYLRRREKPGQPCRRDSRRAWGRSGPRPIRADRPSIWVRLSRRRWGDGRQESSPREERHFPSALGRRPRGPERRSPRAGPRSRSRALHRLAERVAPACGDQCLRRRCHHRRSRKQERNIRRRSARQFPRAAR